MHRTNRLLSAGALLVLALGPASYGHFHVLMPQTVNVEPRSTTEVIYWVGHPFEHQLADAPKPQALFAVSPSGERQDLLASAKEVQRPGQDGQKFAAWQAAVQLPERGDYVIGLSSSPVIEDGQASQSFVKTVVHARVQKGWDRVLNEPAEIVPLTRPYGLRPGTVFQVQVLRAGKPVGGAMVELERFNPKAPSQAELPEEEWITHVAKTDPNGVVTFTLPEPGWWGIAAEVDGGSRTVDGRQLSATYHATFWVFVGEQQTP